MLGSVSRGASRSAAGFLSLVLVAWASGGCRRETPAANESGLSAKKPVTLILGGWLFLSDDAYPLVAQTLDLEPISHVATERPLVALLLRSFGRYLWVERVARARLAASSSSSGS